MKVRLTQEAEADLKAIGDYIARDNPVQALAFIRELRAKCLSVGNAPLAFPLVPRYGDKGVRRRVHRNYLVFYRVEAESVVVLHVLHGARDYLSFLQA